MLRYGTDGRENGHFSVTEGGRGSNLGKKKCYVICGWPLIGLIFNFLRITNLNVCYPCFRMIITREVQHLARTSFR